MDLSRSSRKHLSLVQAQSSVLVVDSDLDNLELTTQVVKLCGCCVMTAQDGQTALQMVEQYQPDIVLVELMLPKLDGISIVRYLRQTANWVPIIAATSLPADLFQQQALLAGCNEYVEKPFQIEQLEAVITRYLDLPASLFLLSG